MRPVETWPSRPRRRVHRRGSTSDAHGVEVWAVCVGNHSAWTPFLRARALCIAEPTGDQRLVAISACREPVTPQGSRCVSGCGEDCARCSGPDGSSGDETVTATRRWHVSKHRILADGSLTDSGLGAAALGVSPRTQESRLRGDFVVGEPS